VALLQELREIGQLTVLHHQVEVRRRLGAREQGDNVRVLQAFEDAYLGLEVVFELGGELRHLHRLYSSVGLPFLQKPLASRVGHGGRLAAACSSGCVQVLLGCAAARVL